MIYVFDGCALAVHPAGVFLVGDIVHRDATGSVYRNRAASGVLVGE
jgi:hypothetical protein